jgi:hypothetical protein
MEFGLTPGSEDEIMEEVKPLIWSSKVLDSACRKGIKNHMLASILIFGLPIDILLSIFLTTRIDHISPGFLLAYVSCIIWLNFGPYFIWYYECRTMNRFFTKLNGLLTPQDIRDLNNKCRSSFSKNYWITIMPWMFFLFAVYGKRFALDVAGTFGYNDYWTWLLSIPIIWIPIIAGMGTWGVVTTITTINDVVKRNLKLDPLHTDKHGGLGCIGDYAIGTTALISSGSLFIPMALQLAAN